MTDRRKAEYRISFEIDTLSSATGMTSTVIVSEPIEEVNLYEPTLFEKINSWFESTISYYDGLIKDTMKSLS